MSNQKITCRECGKGKPRIDFIHRNVQTPYCKACRNNPHNGDLMVSVFREIPPKEKLCVKCCESKPIELFKTSSETKDGRREKCRDCEGGLEKYYVRFEDAVPFIPDVKKGKVCTSCNEEKPTLDFQVSSSSEDGFELECSKCKSDREKEPIAEPVAEDPEENIEPLKTCTKCNDMKAYSFFYKCASTKDGYQRWCKPCMAISKGRPIVADSTKPQETSTGENMAKKKQVTMKACTKCKVEKDLEDFNLSSSSKDGRQYWCKACMRNSRSPMTVQPEEVTPEAANETPEAPRVVEETKPVTLTASKQPSLPLAAAEPEEIPPDEMVLVVARLLQEERNISADLKAKLQEQALLADNMASEVKKIQEELSTANQYVESRDQDVKERDDKIAELMAQIEELKSKVKVKPESKYRTETKELLENLNIPVVRS